MTELNKIEEITELGLDKKDWEKSVSVVLGLNPTQEKIAHILRSYHYEFNELDDGERHRGYEGDQIEEGAIEEVQGLLFQAVQEARKEGEAIGRKEERERLIKVVEEACWVDIHRDQTNDCEPDDGTHEWKMVRYVSKEELLDSLKEGGSNETVN